MTDREKILSAAKYIQFPMPGMVWRDYGMPQIVRIPMEKSDFYKTYLLNQHHFPPMVHFKKTMPVLAELFGFPFSEEDFTIQERFDGVYDVSMPKPKMNLLLDCTCYTDGNCDLTNAKYEDIVFPDQLFDSMYHATYKYSHKISTVANKGQKNKRNLFVSGDSQMIPVIPMLLPYFHKITYSDNRVRVDFFNKMEDVNFTDVIIALYDKPLKYYTSTNLK